MMTTKEEIASWVAFWVTEFIEDSNAIREFEKDAGHVHWRIEMNVKKAFMDDVRRLRDSGYLPYLHDGSTLKKGGAL